MIPKTFHRIWVGGPMPDEFVEYGKTWEKFHPDWEHVLWTEQNMPLLQNQELYDAAEDIVPNNVGQFRSDIARYEILHRFGGVYIDTDFECLKPIDDLIVRCKAFAAWEVPDTWVNNAIMGSEVHNPFFASVSLQLPVRVATFRSRGFRPNRLTGPHLLTSVYRSKVKPPITIFPKNLFYPYLFNELDRKEELFPDSYAVHHWANARRKAT